MKLELKEGIKNACEQKEAFLGKDTRKTYYGETQAITYQVTNDGDISRTSPEIVSITGCSWGLCSFNTEPNTKILRNCDDLSFLQDM